MNTIIEKLNGTRKEWSDKGEQIWSDLTDKRQELYKEIQVQFDKLSEQGQELYEKRQEIFEKGQKLGVTPQEFIGKGQQLFEKRQEFVEKGQIIFGDIEENVVERTLDMLDWAYVVTGQKSNVLRKGRDFFADRAGSLSLKNTATEADYSDVPFEDYDTFNVKKISERLLTMTGDDLQHVLTYETANKNRKTVIKSTVKLMAII
jgi:hypothetical protein